MKNKLPNFLVVGAAKSGTSSLHQYLIQHPEIFMSTINKEGVSVKEPQFLIKSKVQERLHFGVWNWGEYKALFEDVEEEKAIGESTVFYLYYYKEAIKIILLRNPVDRAFSAFQHVSKSVKESLSFEDALSKEEGRLENDLSLTPMVMYKDMGLYYNMVKAYKEQFEHVHVVIYEDFRDKTDIVLNDIFNFLEVGKANKIDSSLRHNVGGKEWKNTKLKNLFQKDNLFKKMYLKLVPVVMKNKIKEKLLNFSTNKSRSMNNTTKESLMSFFKEDIDKLSKLISRDLEHWKI
jgi:translation elongation factor EF-G